MSWIARSNCWEAVKHLKIALVWLSLWKSEVAGFNSASDIRKILGYAEVTKTDRMRHGCCCSGSNSALVVWSRTLWQRHQNRWVFLSRKKDTTCSLCLSQYVAFYWKSTFYCKTRQLREQINRPRCYTIWFLQALRYGLKMRILSLWCLDRWQKA